MNGWLKTAAALAFIGFGCLFLAVCAKAEPVYIKIGESGHCTGVYIGNDYVLTASHCVEDAKELKVSKTDEPEEQHFTVKSIWNAKTRDFAIVKLDKELVKKVSSDPAVETDVGDFKVVAIVDHKFEQSGVSCDYPKLGDKFRIKGYPGPLGYTEVDGYISGAKKERAYWEVSYTAFAPVFGGNSGSGLYTDNGRVMGLLVGLLPGTSLAVIVPTATICNILPR